MPFALFHSERRSVQCRAIAGATSTMLALACVSAQPTGVRDATPVTIRVADTVGFVTDGVRYRGVIKAEIQNRSTETAFLYLCSGPHTYLATLEKKIASEWVTAWTPVCNLEEVRPRVLEGGASTEDVATVHGARWSEDSTSPTFYVPEIAGTYRAVYNVRIASDRAPGVADYRRSNEFVVVVSR